MNHEKIREIIEESLDKYEDTDGIKGTIISLMYTNEDDEEEEKELYVSTGKDTRDEHSQIVGWILSEDPEQGDTIPLNDAKEEREEDLSYIG